MDLKNKREEYYGIGSHIEIMQMKDQNNRDKSIIDKNQIDIDETLTVLVDLFKDADSLEVELILSTLNINQQILYELLYLAQDRDISLVRSGNYIIKR